MKKRGDRPDYADKATTFWLAAETPAGYQKTTLKPFGWAALAQMTEAMDAAFEKIRIDEEKALTPSIAETPSAKISQELPAVKRTESVEEIWNEAYVSFNAGGGGVVTAKAKDGKKAELRGKDKVQAVTAESLHKKIFEGKKCVPKARITVRKTGNSYEIIRVEPVIS